VILFRAARRRLDHRDFRAKLMSIVMRIPNVAEILAAHLNLWPQGTIDPSSEVRSRA